MKTTIVGILGTLVVTLIVYYLNYEKPEIKYTLSEGIPISYTENESNEIAQQLEVRNVGNSEAKNIRLLIRAKIIDYRLQKYSEADEVKEFKTSNSLEIVYPTLPPQGGFRMIMKSTGVYGNNIDINHSGGKGVEALASRSSLGTKIFLIGFWLALCAIIVILIISGRADYLRGKIDFNPDAILKAKRKSMFMKKDDWKTLRDLALKKKLEYERFYFQNNVEKTESYNILSISKLDYLNDEEWNSLVLYAASQLKRKFSEIICSSWKSPTDYLKLLSVPKPANMPDNEWREIVDDVNKTYFELKNRKVSFSFRECRDILKEACSEKPAMLNADLWDNYKNLLKERAYILLLERMYYEVDPIKFIAEFDTSCLRQEAIDELKVSAYRIALNKYVSYNSIFQKRVAEKFISLEKPAWIQESDYKFIRDTADNVISLSNDVERYHFLIQSLDSVLKMIPLSKEKPDYISEETWNKLLEIEREVKIKGDENSRIRRELLAEKEKTETLKAKIERQLSIIDEVLINPERIDKIEDYSNPFASGNFENLKKIALLLKGK